MLISRIWPSLAVPASKRANAPSRTWNRFSFLRSISNSLPSGPSAPTNKLLPSAVSVRPFLRSPRLFRSFQVLRSDPPLRKLYILSLCRKIKPCDVKPFDKPAEFHKCDFSAGLPCWIPSFAMVEEVLPVHCKAMGQSILGGSVFTGSPSHSIAGRKIA